MRRKIKQVMRYSGPLMLFYHPVLAIKHLMRIVLQESHDTLEVEGRSKY
jgi:hypothetical protein